jgi:hypothetical protein
MIAKQELSAQQVASYLMDYEDHFTSHKFSNLYWTSFEKFINEEDPSPECYHRKEVVPGESNPQSQDSAEPPLMDTNPDSNLSLNDEEQELVEVDENGGSGSVGLDAACSNEDDITLVFDSSGHIKPSANQISDYQNRGSLLECVSVWEFVARVEKVSKWSANRKHKLVEADEECEDEDADKLDEDHVQDVLDNATAPEMRPSGSSSVS